MQFGKIFEHDLILLNCQLYSPSNDDLYTYDKIYWSNYTLRFFSHRGDVVELKIFYQDLNYNLIEEVPKYQIENLLGKSGIMAN